MQCTFCLPNDSNGYSMEGANMFGFHHVPCRLRSQKEIHIGLIVRKAKQTTSTQLIRVGTGPDQTRLDRTPNGVSGTDRLQCVLILDSTFHHQRDMGLRWVSKAWVLVSHERETERSIVCVFVSELGLGFYCLLGFRIRVSVSCSWPSYGHWISISLFSAFLDSFPPPSLTSFLISSSSVTFFFFWVPEIVETWWESVCWMMRWRICITPRSVGNAKSWSNLHPKL